MYNDHLYMQYDLHGVACLSGAMSKCNNDENFEGLPRVILGVQPREPRDLGAQVGDDIDDSSYRRGGGPLVSDGQTC
jgi:hypothetical protein